MSTPQRPEGGAVDIVSASAGSGKTYRLAKELQKALSGDPTLGPLFASVPAVPPENVLATTFTVKAAAELQERARQHLLRIGRFEEAQRLAAARIGTVNAVCGRLVSDFAFELGLPPDQLVLDEGAARIALRRALSRVITVEETQALAELHERFPYFAVLESVRRVIEQARANGIPSERLEASAERSLGELRGVFAPPLTSDGRAIDAALRGELDALEDAIAASHDNTKTTETGRARIAKARSLLRRGLALPWDEWAALAKLHLAKSCGLDDRAAVLREVAGEYEAHPHFHRDLERAIRLVFGLAARGLTAYTAHKAETGTLDFIDQETMALSLLGREDVRERLRGELGLVLVDEFQDTSPLQLAIFLRLAELAPRSLWVGDQKQSIFGFRGSDPELMESAMETLLGGGEPETLPYSWRSRPELVELTSEIFARAFARHGIPEERVRLTPAPGREEIHRVASSPAVEEPRRGLRLVQPLGATPDSAGDSTVTATREASAVAPERELGPIIERWRLTAKNQSDDSAALAAAVCDLLADPTVSVRDRTTGAARPLRASDVAVLCRTRASSRRVATSLADLGLRAVLPRVGLLATPEGQVALAGLRLWVDPTDRLAAATIARLAEMDEAGDAWLAAALSEPNAAAFFRQPRAERLLAARRAGEASSIVGPVGALDTVFEALGLRALCADWGETAIRLANLDALRAHAEVFAAGCATEGAAATPAGLVTSLEALQADGQDQQASVAADDAITVSTWHAAKGLEWPIVVLFDLENDKSPSVFGLSAERAAPNGDPEGEPAPFAFADPLGDRWLRLWPEIYHGNRKTAVHERLQDHPVAKRTQERRDREELRLLYVGWTRARDRVVLAGRPTKLLEGALRHLAGVDGGLLLSDPQESRALWAGREVHRVLRDGEPQPRARRDEEPGSVLAAAGERTHPPAFANPSDERRSAIAEGASAPLHAHGRIETLGDRLALTGVWDEQRVGEAFHRFLAADGTALDDAERADLAGGIVLRWGLAANLDPARLVLAGERLRAWVDRQGLGETCVLRREWPVAHRKVAAGGTVLRGTVDLVLETGEAVVVVDHKTFPGSADAALARALEYGPQVWSYADALAAATGKRATACWIHLPVVGSMVEIRRLPTT